MLGSVVMSRARLAISARVYSRTTRGLIGGGRKMVTPPQKPDPIPSNNDQFWHGKAEMLKCTFWPESSLPKSDRASIGLRPRRGIFHLKFFWPWPSSYRCENSWCDQRWLLLLPLYVQELIIPIGYKFPFVNLKVLIETFSGKLQNWSVILQSIC